MPNYKDTANKVHFLDSDYYEYMLPPGSVRITDEEAAIILSQQLPSKEERIALLQSAYEIDLERLNRAWLAALIADGIGEAARQAAIKQQMDDAGAQLEIDILTIIMEE